MAAHDTARHLSAAATPRLDAVLDGAERAAAQAQLQETRQHEREQVTGAQAAYHQRQRELNAGRFTDAELARRSAEREQATTERLRELEAWLEQHRTEQRREREIELNMEIGGEWS